MYNCIWQTQEFNVSSQTFVFNLKSTYFNFKCINPFLGNVEILKVIANGFYWKQDDFRNVEADEKIRLLI